jgi:hypothetical protein
MRETDIEDALKRLDWLTQEEARIAAQETMKAVEDMVNRVAHVDDDDDDEVIISGVPAVEHRVMAVDDKVTAVNFDDKSKAAVGIHGA